MTIFTITTDRVGGRGKMSEREVILSSIAEVCHEANRAYCKSIGDDSQVPWAEAPSWQRESAQEGVRMHVMNPNSDAGASHACWVARKLREGWKWGLTKNALKKEHPCILPFNKLPPAQQVKDHIFRSIVHALGQSLMPAGA